jgi:hypothetical protein
MKSEHKHNLFTVELASVQKHARLSPQHFPLTMLNEPSSSNSSKSVPYITQITIRVTELNYCGYHCDLTALKLRSKIRAILASFLSVHEISLQRLLRHIIELF